MPVQLRAGILLAGCCSFPFALAQTPAPHTNTNAPPHPHYGAALHDDALAQWRSGRLSADELLLRLSTWLATAGNADQVLRLRSDRIVVAVQAGLHAQAIAFARAAPLASLQPYALAPLIAAARAAGDSALQGEAVRQLAAAQPGSWDAEVQQALWRIDQRELDDAQARIEALARRPQATLPAHQVTVRELRGALAEARGDRPAALGHYQDVLELAPDHRYALRAEVFLTSALGAPGAALATAQGRPALHSPLELASLRQAALGERLRWALAERDLLDQAPQRFAALEGVIAESEALQSELEAASRQAAPADAPEWLRLRRALAADRVLALFERGRYAQAIALYESLDALPGGAPYYAKAAAAGAHAQLRRPHLAVPLYEAALREGGSAVRMPSDIHVGLVYAYLDTARFGEADALLDGMIARTPPLLALSPERGRPNNDYGDLQGLRALVDLYTDRPARAEAGFAALAGLAPLNAPYRTGQARTLRLRQHPQAAQALFEEILTDRPEAVDTRAGHAETLFDSGWLGEGRRRVDALVQSHPEHTAVRGAARTRDTVMAPRLEVDAGFARDGGTLSNRDAGVDTRLYSGWSDAGRRVFAHLWLGGADLDPSDQRYARGGLGLQWRHGPWQWSGELHQASGGARRTGATLAAQWRASDAWLLAGRIDSNTTDVPWRARQAGISAREAQAEARYIVNESRSFSGQVRQLALSDGNDRAAAGVAWRERWVSAPRFQLETTLAADAARSSLQAVPYFSPARESGVALTARGQWLTWKRDDAVLLQIAEAGTGSYRQQGFAAGATTVLRYSHEWNWGAGWQLRYGLGTSTHPYDGVRERRSEVFIHFTRPFL